MTPGKFLFGGCGLAAGIAALEEASGRPTVYAAAHYLSFAQLGNIVEVKVDLAVVGKRVTQARATAFTDEREILTVSAALGRSELDAPTPWVTMPDVPPPEECLRRVVPRVFDTTLFDPLETRIAIGRTFDQLAGTPGPSVSALWARLRSRAFRLGAVVAHARSSGSIGSVARHFW